MKFPYNQEPTIMQRMATMAQHLDVLCSAIDAGELDGKITYKISELYAPNKAKLTFTIDENNDLIVYGIKFLVDDKFAQAVQLEPDGDSSEENQLDWEVCLSLRLGRQKGINCYALVGHDGDDCVSDEQLDELLYHKAELDKCNE